jgi:ParB family chromosome partitioning protein
VIGKSRSHLSNSLRLLNLPEGAKMLLREGKISAGHARALLASPDPVALLEKIVAKGLSVREAERLEEAAPESSSSQGPGARKGEFIERMEKPADTRAMEKVLFEQLGMEVTITHRAGEAGEVLVRYKTFDELEFLCRRLRGD